MRSSSGTGHSSTGCGLGYSSSATEPARPADLSTGVIFKLAFGILLAKFLNDLGQLLVFPEAVAQQGTL